jgi:beta-glucosidase-like glycosyl hydrolase
VATISPAVVTDLLEKQLGFKGIVVTDALDMAGLTHLFANNIGRAAVEAFKAGNDLLLIPADLTASYNAMVQAVRSGEISRERLDRSVLKILKTKASLALEDARLVDVNALANVPWASRQAWPSASRSPMPRSRWYATTARFCPSSLQIPGNRKGRTSVYHTGGDAQPDVLQCFSPTMCEQTPDARSAASFGLAFPTLT